MVKGAEQLSEYESREIQNLFKQFDFPHENLIESYLILTKNTQQWTEATKISNFVKWCNYAHNWGYKYMPANPEDNVRFLKSVEAATNAQQQWQNQKYWHDLNQYHQAALEVQKGVLEFAYMSIKSLVLINGSAIIAILTLLGTIWKEAGDAKGAIFDSLCYFVIGVVLAVVISFCAYLTQSIYSEFAESKRLMLVGNTLRILAITAAFLSLGLFAYGAFDLFGNVKQYMLINR